VAAKIGLTGGIGSGKSAVADAFAAHDVQRVLVVTCARAERIRRIKNRDGNRMSEADIERVMQTQVDDAARLQFADEVIDNNGDLDDLHRQVRQLHKTYTALFS